MYIGKYVYRDLSIQGYIYIYVVTYLYRDISTHTCVYNTQPLTTHHSIRFVLGQVRKLHLEDYERELKSSDDKQIFNYLTHLVPVATPVDNGMCAF